jgi:hypothetical protein
MDPRCLDHWPWNQKCDTACPQDIAHSEIYHEFFIEKKEVVIEIPKCLDGFIWTGIRFTTREPDTIQWYPLAMVSPREEGPLIHTIFVQYGEWNILPIRYTPEFIEALGKPVLKLQFPSEASGKIELLAQKLA